jgi:tetratricopeptide (TPR) repeat protein
LLNSQDDYEKAIWYLVKSVEIQENIPSRNEASLATSYNNIGLVYDNMRKYSDAPSYYSKSLERFFLHIILILLNHTTILKST